MAEGKKFSKKLVIILSIGCGLLIIRELFALFSLNDLSHHRFEALAHIIYCWVYAYAIYFFIKNRDKGEDSHIDKEG